MVLCLGDYRALAKLLVPFLKYIYGFIEIFCLRQQFCIASLELFHLVSQVLPILSHSLQCLSISFSPFLFRDLAWGGWDTDADPLCSFVGSFDSFTCFCSKVFVFFSSSFLCWRSSASSFYSSLTFVLHSSRAWSPLLDALISSKAFFQVSLCSSSSFICFVVAPLGALLGFEVPVLLLSLQQFCGYIG